MYGGFPLHQLLHIVPGYNNMFHVKHFYVLISCFKQKRTLPISVLEYFSIVSRETIYRLLITRST